MKHKGKGMKKGPITARTKISRKIKTKMRKKK